MVSLSIRARLILFVLAVLAAALVAALWAIDTSHANERSALERNLLWGFAALAGVAVLGALWVARGISGSVDGLRLAARQGQRVQTLGRLTGGVTHDFNNLLGVISNSTHVLQRLPAGPGRDSALASIQRAVERGSQLTQHLQRFAAHQPGPPVRVDLAGFLPGSAELMKAAVGSSVQIECDVEPGTGSITVDPNELELSLVNLALNARDAMAGRGTLRLHARNAGGAAGSHVLLSVSHTDGSIHPVEGQASAGTAVTMVLPMAGSEPDVPMHSPAQADQRGA